MVSPTNGRDKSMKTMASSTRKMGDKNSKSFSQLQFQEWANVSVNSSSNSLKRYVVLQNNLKLLVWT